MDSILDLAFKLGGAICTFIVVPAVRWAIKVNSKLATLTQDVQNVAEQIEEERAERHTILEAINNLRGDLHRQSTEILQRITRVETKLEKQI